MCVCASPNQVLRGGGGDARGSEDFFPPLHTPRRPSTKGDAIVSFKEPLQLRGLAGVHRTVIRVSHSRTRREGGGREKYPSLYSVNNHISSKASAYYYIHEFIHLFIRSRKPGRFSNRPAFPSLYGLCTLFPCKKRAVA